MALRSLLWLATAGAAFGQSASPIPRLRAVGLPGAAISFQRDGREIARYRYGASLAIDVPAIDFGIAQFVLLPAESFVQYQLWAREIRPDAIVIAAGFGE